MQQEILHALTYSPFSLRTINIYNILGTPYCYYTTWRALKRLRKNKLVEKIKNHYKITELGIVHLERRRLGLNPFSRGLINNE